LRNYPLYERVFRHVGGGVHSPDPGGKARREKIFIGHDYTFGRGKGGNETFLIDEGARSGFTVEVIPPFTEEGVVISSTRIREAILAGNVALAARYLGRLYNLKGTIIPGHHRGEKLGFPTANMSPEKILIPADGVYVVEVLLGAVTYGGVMNIGNNPTFEDVERSLEVFLLDFEGDIYGKEMEVFFVERLRGERKFPTAAELVAQITQDVKRAREILDAQLHHEEPRG